MKDVYKTSLLGFGGMVTGAALLHNSLINILPGSGLIAGLVLSLGGIIGF